jgi:hypothetical protein
LINDDLYWLEIKLNEENNSLDVILEQAINSSAQQNSALPKPDTYNLEGINDLKITYLHQDEYSSLAAYPIVAKLWIQPEKEFGLKPINIDLFFK